MREYGFNTTLLHGSEDKRSLLEPHRFLFISPVLSVTIRQEELEKIFANKTVGYSHARINNPTHRVF